MQIKYRNFAIYKLFFSLKFAGIVFVSTSAFINSSHVIAESPIIFAK